MRNNYVLHFLERAPADEPSLGLDSRFVAQNRPVRRFADRDSSVEVNAKMLRGQIECLESRSGLISNLKTQTGAVTGAILKQMIRSLRKGPLLTWRDYQN